jgi:hypothetical protein
MASVFHYCSFLTFRRFILVLENCALFRFNSTLRTKMTHTLESLNNCWPSNTRSTPMWYVPCYVRNHLSRVYN